MDAKGASVVLSLFLISETNKGKTTTMKTKLKSSIIAYHMAVGHRVAAAMVCALCAVGLSAFAEESVTINEVKSVQPWDRAKGTITVDYSLGGLDAAKEYKVAFDITANGVTKGVTNAAAKLTSGQQTVFTYDTVSLFGAETRAEDAQVKVSLIAIKASSEPEYVVMKMGSDQSKELKWATMNLGAENVTDCGDYFAWGETAPYYEGTGGWPATPKWMSGKASGYAWQSYCGSSSFSEWSTPPYDATTKILKPESDAAAQILGNGWRMPTSQEFQNLANACGGSSSYDITTYASTACGKATTFTKGIYWCGNYDGVAGCLFCDGTNKLFFPAAGGVEGVKLSSKGSSGLYWSSSLYSNTALAYRLNFTSSSVSTQGNRNRFNGVSVRPVKEVK